MAVIEVITPGPLTTIQDLGRRGWAHIGVPPSGAMDSASLIAANRLVGNDDDAPGLETTLVGPKLRFSGQVVIAVAGAPVPGVPMNQALTFEPGEILNIGKATSGLRTYVAFKGGLHVPLTLGSVATDTLTGLGPTPLQRGDFLSTRAHPAHNTGTHPYDPAPAVHPPSTPRLQIMLGPREDWFSPRALGQLTSERFTVTAQSNRIGLRLAGPALKQIRSDQLLSEGLVTGSIQVPPDGEPILLGPDHPTTGGYPVIATLVTSSLPSAGQLRPGQEVRFSVADPVDAGSARLK